MVKSQDVLKTTDLLQKVQEVSGSFLGINVSPTAPHPTSHLHFQLPTPPPDRTRHAEPGVGQEMGVGTVVQVQESFPLQLLQTVCELVLFLVFLLCVHFREFRKYRKA